MKDLHLIVGSGTSARETSKRLVAISGASELSPESNNSEPDDSSGDGSSGGEMVNVLLRRSISPKSPISGCHPV